MQIIPLAATPAQIVNVALNGQQCQIEVAQKGDWMFMTLTVGNLPVLSGAICQNVNPMVRDVYLEFVGDLVFFDTQGASDPIYSGIGTRYFLVYLTPADLP